ncbi:MAG: hypothetical protein WCJ09_13035 [Planctomycetota bacterium]
MRAIKSCDELQGRLRAICRGEVTDLRLSTINAYRAGWGLPALNEIVAGCTSETNPPELTPTHVTPPTLLIRGWNFAQAISRWTLAGMPRRTDAEIEERLEICQACPFLKNHHCLKCGCACVESNRLINKLALATEKCPEGNWE